MPPRVVIVLVTPGRALAHGAPLPLADWGGFTPAATRCQRALDRVGAAYDHLVGVPSTTSAPARVAPGDPEQSRLFLLLAKATLGRDDVEGRAMPLDQPPLGADELEALRLWIAAGAPRGGTVAGTPDLLGACLPAPLDSGAAIPVHRP